MEPLMNGIPIETALLLLTCPDSSDHGAALADQPRQNLDDTARADAPVDLDRQPFLGPLVGDGQALELQTVDAAVRPCGRKKPLG
jgi:hypothetical protein